jgi:hypothetical protein
MLGVEAVDEALGMVYFTCNVNDPRQRQVYAVKLDGSGPNPSPTKMEPITPYSRMTANTT